MQKITLSIFFILISGLAAKAKGTWFKVSTSYDYSIYNLDNTGLGSDFKSLTKINDLSLNHSGFNYGSFNVDIGGKHFFGGATWVVNVYPDVDNSYYLPVSTNTYAVADNVEVNVSRNQYEGRFGFGRFQNDDHDKSFFGYGVYVFGGEGTYTIEVNNRTVNALNYKDIHLDAGSIFSDFKSRRFVYGVGVMGFFQLAGNTTAGVAIELKYTHCNSANWELDDQTTGLSTAGYNLITISLAPTIGFSGN